MVVVGGLKGKLFVVAASMQTLVSRPLVPPSEQPAAATLKARAGAMTGVRRSRVVVRPADFGQG